MLHIFVLFIYFWVCLYPKVPSLDYRIRPNFTTTSNKRPLIVTWLVLHTFSAEEKVIVYYRTEEELMKSLILNSKTVLHFALLYLAGTVWTLITSSFKSFDNKNSCFSSWLSQKKKVWIRFCKCYHSNLFWLSIAFYY